MSDCSSVLSAIDRAWSGGSAWRLANQHRQAMLESILLLMREFREHGGVAIFLWTPSHHGVLPNNYADMIVQGPPGLATRGRGAATAAAPADSGAPGTSMGTSDWFRYTRRAARPDRACRGVVCRRRTTALRRRVYGHKTVPLPPLRLTIVYTNLTHMRSP